MSNVNELMIKLGNTAAVWLERILASAIVVGVIAFGVASTFALAGADWRIEGTFYNLVNRVLMMAIGVELVRTLLTHDLGAILELLALVIARKILSPDVTALDIASSVLGFVGLLAARHYFLLARERVAATTTGGH